MRSNYTTNIPTSSAAVTQTGSTIDARQLYRVSAQAVVTGTSTGTLNIQASNDVSISSVDSSGNPIPTNWSNISTATVAIAGAGVYLIPNLEIGYRFIRTQFVFNNGATGTVTVNVNTQGF